MWRSTRAPQLGSEHVAVDARAAAWERLDSRRARRRRRLAVLRARSEAEEAEAADLRVFLAADRPVPVPVPVLYGHRSSNDRALVVKSTATAHTPHAQTVTFALAPKNYVARR